MRILAHCGYWTKPEERNSVAAFARAFALGFGAETDVRDSLGQLVIAHDLPLGGEMELDAFLHLARRRVLPLALNIKSDGLAVPLARAMRGYQGEWFVFDMSVPDLRAHLAAGNPVYTRLSDIEPRPACLEACEGVWLDSFEGQWFGRTVIEDLLARGKRVCVVSPELHGRDPSALWASLRRLATHPGLALCTDQPEQAMQHFHPAVAGIS